MSWTTLDTGLRLLVKSRAVWMAYDPFFMIEVGAFTSIAGDVGVHSTKQAVLAAFPEPGAHKPVAETDAELADLAASLWFRFVHPQAKAIVSQVRSSLATWSRGALPTTRSS